VIEVWVVDTGRWRDRELRVRLVLYAMQCYMSMVYHLIKHFKHLVSKLRVRFYFIKKIPSFGLISRKSTIHSGSHLIIHFGTLSHAGEGSSSYK
jgi:hypothetical protein